MISCAALTQGAEGAARKRSGRRGRAPVAPSPVRVAPLSPGEREGKQGV